MTGPSTPELTFWPGSMGSRGFIAVLDAARAGGFPATALSPLTLHELLVSGHDWQWIRAEADARGVRPAHLDGVASWAPIRYADDLPAPLKQRFDFTPTEALDLAEAAGMDSVLACGAFAAGTVPLDELVASYAAFCRMAEDRGLRVELEFVPFWGIRDLATAWEIVRRADRPNGTLMVDTWHLLRASDEPRTALDLLSDIPKDKVTGLQLADALLSPQSDTLFGEGRFRRFPGDGELDMDTVIRLLLDKGGLRSVGVEVFGEAIDGLSTEDAGIRAAKTVQTALARATR
ncbi:sugar phosphate isomerase/epimerase family protein [Streptomyces pseudogriseolus]|uniref:sugar phosphate isomerase/epimerase family protein n=1 Tax=Streptomyces pseudogriseolus TaxID=36817 RepID=UPI003FA2EA2E